MSSSCLRDDECIPGTLRVLPPFALISNRSTILVITVGVDDHASQLGSCGPQKTCRDTIIKHCILAKKPLASHELLCSVFKESRFSSTVVTP
jgi:hypothetical protein